MGAHAGRYRPGDDDGRTAQTRAPLPVPHEPFCLTYGDGLGNIDITSLIAFHTAHGKDATLCAVVPPGRYGALEMNSDAVRRFVEKPPGDNAYVNGGFFVLNPATIDRIGAARALAEQQMNGFAERFPQSAVASARTRSRRH